jgi:cyclopropane fatty-acyl-phospholipid synthase-like methyltransferase
VVRVRCWCSDLAGHRSEQGLPFPPALLRYRVSESLSKDQFLWIGKGSAAHIENQIRLLDSDLGSARRILDFGCGCGRTLRWLVDKYPDSEFHGADVDGDAIHWCERYLDRGRFARIDPEPPMQYPPGYFDVIYCFSVFTHLNEHMQNLWLLDLKRVLKPGGILLLTVHSERTATNHLKDYEIEELKGSGLIHKTTRKLIGIVPDWYNTTWHSRQYIVTLLQSLFQDVHYTVVPDGAQDLVLARAPKA